MGFAVFAFVAIFMLIASGGLLLFYREAMLKRISEAINPRRKQKSLMTTIKQTGFSIGNVVERFENVMPKSEKEVSIVKQRLARAGYRNESAVKIFYGSKVADSAAAVPDCGGERTGAPGPVLCVPDGAGRRVSGAGLLAGKED